MVRLFVCSCALCFGPTGRRQQSGVFAECRDGTHFLRTLLLTMNTWWPIWADPLTRPDLLFVTFMFFWDGFPVWRRRVGSFHIYAATAAEFPHAARSHPDSSALAIIATLDHHMQAAGMRDVITEQIAHELCASVARVDSLALGRS